MDITVEFNTQNYVVQPVTTKNEFEIIVSPISTNYIIEVAQLGEKGEKGDKGDVGDIDGGIIF